MKEFKICIPILIEDEDHDEIMFYVSGKSSLEARRKVEKVFWRLMDELDNLDNE